MTDDKPTGRDAVTPVEVQLQLDLRRPFRSPALAETEPLLLAEPTEPLAVLSADERLRASVPAETFDDFRRRFDDLTVAIWSERGRAELPADLLAERALAYSSTREFRSARGRIYLFDLSDETFLNPFTVTGPVVVQPEDLPTVQLTLDGRAVENVGAAALGVRQAEVLRVLKYRDGITSGEAGALMHALHAGCPAYQREDRYASQYQGTYCCRKASDVGSDVLTHMSRQGRVWNDDGIWRVYPEGAWSA